MKKKLAAILLAAVMAAGLLPVTAFAAGSTNLTKNADITLSEQYLYAGGTDGNGWYTETAFYAAPVVTDLDGDGKLEVLTAAESLVVMDAATGAIKWRINSGKDRSSAYDTWGNAAGFVYADFLVTDLDRDGKQEIVIGYNNGSVSVLDNNGYFKAGWPKQPTTYSIRSLVADDLNGDGKLEIVVGAGIDDPKSVWVYDYQGNVASGWPQLDSSQDGTRYQLTDRDYLSRTAYSAGVYANGITTGDLDGDGLPEIIVPTDNAYINAYNYDGSLVKASDIYSDQYGSRPWGKIALWEDYGEEKAHENEGWGWPNQLDTRAHTYRSELAVAGTVYTDVDGDGKSEVVITSLMVDRTTYETYGNNATTINDTKYMTVFILNQDRSRYVNQALGFDWTSAPNETNSQISGPRRSYEASLKSMSGNVFPVPVCADLDGDGYQEILFNSYDGKVHCFSLDKSEWSFTLPKNSSTIYEYASPVVCVDLDGDGTKEVIFSSWTDCQDKDLRTDGYGGTGVNGALYVLNCNGQLLKSIDLHSGYCNWEDRNNPAAGLTNGVLAAPVVRDVDGDGKYEVLLNTTNYALCAYEITVNSPGAVGSNDPKPTEPPAATGFTDVKADDWFAKEVQWAVEKGVTSGTGNNTFTPGRVCSHGEIITFLWRAAGKPAASATAPVETQPYDDFRAAANWAYEKGVIDDSFKYDADCTRASTVTYMWKAAGSPTAAPISFADVPADADYAMAVNWAAEKGVTQGAGDINTFAPATTCTRGQIATFLYRAYA